MQLHTIDLNLLVLLDALLSTRSVKLAAERIALSPSAASHGLARLRDLLDDPVLVRSGRAMVPTARAQALASELRRLLEGVDLLLRDSASFDPAALQRTFTVVGTDYTELFPFLDLSALVAERAPEVELRSLHVVGDPTAQLRGSDADLMFGVQWDAPEDIQSEPLFEEYMVCVMRSDHPALDKRLTPKRFAALDHVLVAPRGTPRGVVDTLLEQRGLRRRVQRLVSTFGSAPHLVATSDYVVTMPAGVATYYAEFLDVAVVPVPIDIPSFHISQMWHRRHTHDPAHRWLREQVVEAVTHMPKPACSKRQRR